MVSGSITTENDQREIFDRVQNTCRAATAKVLRSGRRSLFECGWCHNDKSVSRGVGVRISGRTTVARPHTPSGTTYRASVGPIQ